MSHTHRDLSTSVDDYRFNLILSYDVVFVAKSIVNLPKGWGLRAYVQTHIQHLKCT